MGKNGDEAAGGLMKLWLRAAAFTLLIPGVVAGWVPYLIASSFSEPVTLGPWKFAGVPVLLSGVVLYFMCLLSFVVRGGGTPAIWFTAPVRFLIGQEPSRFVESLAYRWSRNPMYLGVLLSVAGQGFLLEDLSYFFYCIGLWAIFHLVVVLLEEQHLKKKFGESYEQYCATTPRWIGLPRSGERKQIHETKIRIL
jgi:protein-S-isoprenylcysteine O-methyltransferase Ste14